MIALLSLIGIFCAMFLASVLYDRWQERLRAQMASHVTREWVRQQQQLHPYERGEVPAEERVDRMLAWRIAVRRNGPPARVLKFKGER